MKKYFVCFLIIFICLCVVSCSKPDNSAVAESVSNHSVLNKDDKINNTLINAEFTENSEVGGADILPRKYRNNYYQIPTFFAKIIDSDTYSKWEKEYYSNNYADDTNVMVMVAYIKEFNISREDFDRANLEYAKFIDETYSHICLDPQDYADQEMQEIYNADIIYTFDNDVINKYYLGIDYPFLNEYQYDEAVANGKYQTRTIEFIDVEQMEAEIIAKYGETEIVPEEPTDVPEEPTNALEEIVTITEETIDALEEAESTQSAETVNAE